MTINKQKVKKFLISFFSISLIVLTVVTVFLFFFAFVPGKALYDQIKFAKNDLNEIKTAITNKNLELGKEKINLLKRRLAVVETKYKKLKLVGSLPYINSFYKDGIEVIKIGRDSLETGEILIQAIEPYKDFLGIAGAASDSAQTTQDRMTFLTESVEGIIPYLDTIEQKIANIETSINKIDAILESFK